MRSALPSVAISYAKKNYSVVNLAVLWFYIIGTWILPGTLAKTTIKSKRSKMLERNKKGFKSGSYTGKLDTDTRTALVVKYRADIQRFIELRVNSAAIAMELTQDTFEKYLQIDNPAKIENPRSYLLKIAANLSCNHLRREQIYVVDSSDSNEPQTTPLANDPSPEEWLMYAELHEMFRIAFFSLPPRCREIFYLRRFRDFSSKEIAERFHITQRMVQKHLIKAMKHFNEQLR